MTRLRWSGATSHSSQHASGLLPDPRPRVKCSTAACSRSTATNALFHEQPLDQQAFQASSRPSAVPHKAVRRVPGGRPQGCSARLYCHRQAASEPADHAPLQDEDGGTLGHRLTISRVRRSERGGSIQSVPFAKLLFLKSSYYAGMTLS